MLVYQSHTFAGLAEPRAAHGDYWKEMNCDDSWQVCVRLLRRCAMRDASASDCHGPDTIANAMEMAQLIN
jgi:hypothetical protein